MVTDLLKLYIQVSKDGCNSLYKERGEGELSYFYDLHIGWKNGQRRYRSSTLQLSFIYLFGITACMYLFGIIACTCCSLAGCFGAKQDLFLFPLIVNFSHTLQPGRMKGFASSQLFHIRLICSSAFISQVNLAIWVNHLMSFTFGFRLIWSHSVFTCKLMQQLCEEIGLVSTHRHSYADHLFLRITIQGSGTQGHTEDHFQEPLNQSCKIWACGDRKGPQHHQ